ncbi:MAG TPA: hypothetical protein VFX01_01755 [Methylophilaceae bacterium]|nr:hypothetical protein [Methylophilaceae bacterium]
MQEKLLEQQELPQLELHQQEQVLLLQQVQERFQQVQQQELQQQEPQQHLQICCKQSEQVQTEQPTERSESFSYPLIRFNLTIKFNQLRQLAESRPSAKNSTSSEKKNHTILLT